MMDSYLIADYETARAKALEVHELFMAATANCTDIDYHVKVFQEEWYALITRGNWSQIETQIYEENKAYIHLDFFYMLGYWYQTPNYALSGDFFAAIQDSFKSLVPKTLGIDQQF